MALSLRCLEVKRRRSVRGAGCGSSGRQSEAGTQPQVGASSVFRLRHLSLIASAPASVLAMLAM